MSPPAEPPYVLLILTGLAGMAVGATALFLLVMDQVVPKKKRDEEKQ
jgi:hypothetical protein